MMRAVLLVIALLLFAGRSVRAQPEELPITDQRLKSNGLMPESDPSAANGFPVTTDGAPVPMGTDITSDPDWDQLPRGSRRWNIDLAYVPTTIFNDTRDVGQAIRLNLGREEQDGFGQRGRLWLFQQDVGREDLSATTFTYDFYRRMQFQSGELKFGWGPMAGYLANNSWRHRFDQHFYGVGAGVVAEGFYPLLRYERTDIGPIGYGRLATLVGVWDNSGSLEFGTGSIAIIDEFAWGLELRHRFGRHQDKTFYVDVTRELQNWGSPYLPYVAGTSFQGTAINFGFAW